MKKFALIMVVCLIGMIMNGCIYYNNKGWNDLDSSEQEEAKQTLDEMRAELEEDEEYIGWILDSISGAMG